jgi:hypothetical protein
MVRRWRHQQAARCDRRTQQSNPSSRQRTAAVPFAGSLFCTSAGTLRQPLSSHITIPTALRVRRSSRARLASSQRSNGAAIMLAPFVVAVLFRMQAVHTATPKQLLRIMSLCLCFASCAAFPVFDCPASIESNRPDSVWICTIFAVASLPRSLTPRSAPLSPSQLVCSFPQRVAVFLSVSR